MDFSKVLAFLAVLVVVLPSSAFGTIFGGLPPAFAPFYDQLCDKIICGKGTCKAQDTFIFTYECECEAGWNRSPIDKVNDYLKFLPCVFPECSFELPNVALPPIPEKPISVFLPDFNPCYFTKCGAGTCTNTSFYEYTCECNPGYKNLFNISAFPCYSESSLGPDCATLGIEVSDAKVDANGINEGTSFLPGKFHWMTVFVICVVMALWK